MVTPAPSGSEQVGPTPPYTIAAGEKLMSAETGKAIEGMVTLAALQQQLRGADIALDLERRKSEQLERALSASLASLAELRAAQSELAAVKAKNQFFLDGYAKLSANYNELEAQLAAQSNFPDNNPTK